MRGPRRALSSVTQLSQTYGSAGLLRYPTATLRGSLPRHCLLRATLGRTRLACLLRSSLARATLRRTRLAGLPSRRLATLRRSLLRRCLLPTLGRSLLRGSLLGTTLGRSLARHCLLPTLGRSLLGYCLLAPLGRSLARRRLPGGLPRHPTLGWLTGRSLLRCLPCCSASFCRRHWSPPFSRDVRGVGAVSPAYLFTAVLKAAPAENFTPFDAAICTGSPVRGLRPVRAGAR